MGFHVVVVVVDFYFILFFGFYFLGFSPLCFLTYNKIEKELS
jgi:hypothetical protein